MGTTQGEIISALALGIIAGGFFESFSDRREINPVDRRTIGLGIQIAGIGLFFDCPVALVGAVAAGVLSLR